jgi:hypothetical protein
MRPVPSKYPVTLGYRAKAKFDPKYIHRGIDYGCPTGTPVQATVGGEVVWAGDARKSSKGSYGPAYGIQVIIRVGSIYCLYAHLSEEHVTKGQKVKIGDVIGESGATGNVRGAHLHYQECTAPPAAYTSDRKPQFLDDAPTKPTVNAVDKEADWVVNTTKLHGRDFPDVDYGNVITSQVKGKRIFTTKEAKVNGRYWDYRPTDGAWYAQEYLERTHSTNRKETKNYRVLRDTELRDVPGNGRILRVLDPDDVFISVGWEMYGNQRWVVNAQYEWASMATLIEAGQDTPQIPQPQPEPDPEPEPEPEPEKPHWPDAPAHWYPLADRKTQNFTGKYPADNMDTNCVILHSTEGFGWPSYGGGQSAPHMTIMPDFKNKKVIVRQHLAGNKSARALVNRSGGVETNTANVFQIEMVGTCDPNIHKKYASTEHIYMPEAPQWFIDGVADVIRWLDKQYPKFQIADGAPRGWVGPEKSPARESAPQRMSAAEWNKFYGIAGHQHVPENAHWDPGAFPIKKLISAAKGQAPAPDPAPQPEQPKKRLSDYSPRDFGENKSGPQITLLGERLVAHGYGKYYSVGPGPTWGAADFNAVKAFQEAQGWSGSDADGYPGTQTLKRLDAAPKPAPEPEKPPVDGPDIDKPDPTLKVAKFRALTLNVNARYMGGYSGRVAGLAKIRDKARASVVFVQEQGDKADADKLSKKFGPEWRYVRQGDSIPITTAIHWDNNKFQLLDSGRFVTEGTHRWATWAVLKHRSSGVVFVATTTHLQYLPKGKNSHSGKNKAYNYERERQFKKVLQGAKGVAKEWRDKLQLKVVPVIAAGDLNGDLNDPYDGPGRAMAAEGFNDSDKVAQKRIDGDKGTTAVTDGKFDKGNRIDRWALDDDGVECLEQETWFGHPHTDHNGVEVYLAITNE